MSNRCKDNKASYNRFKAQKLQKKIRIKINDIQNKINKNNSQDNNLILESKVKKLHEIYNSTFRTAKEKNRKKEVQIINSRIEEYQFDLKYLDRCISYENKKITKIKIKICKLINRRERLESQVFNKKKIRRVPSLIRDSFRKYRLMDGMIS